MLDSANITFGCGCRARPRANLWWGAGGGAAVQAGSMSCWTVQLHSLGREHNLGLKSLNQYQSPRPLTPQRRETVSSHYLHGRQLKDAIHIYNTLNNRLGSWNYQEHAHAWVCSAFTYSVLQCPGVMPGFTCGWRLASAACAPRYETNPTVEHGTWNLLNFLFDVICERDSTLLVRKLTIFLYIWSRCRV